MELLSIRHSFQLINDFELNESTWKFDLRICYNQRRKITLGSENVRAYIDTLGAHEYVNCTNLFKVSLQR